MKFVIFSAIAIGVAAIACMGYKKEIKTLEGSSEQYQKYIINKFPEGKKLFKATCSSCHETQQNGTTVSTNFDSTQLHNYGIDFIKGDYKNHAVAASLTQDEFDLIILYLTYRK